MFDRRINFYCCVKCGHPYHKYSFFKLKERCKVCGKMNKPHMHEVIKKTRGEKNFWDLFHGAIVIGILVGILIGLIGWNV